MPAGTTLGAMAFVVERVSNGLVAERATLQARLGTQLPHALDRGLRAGRELQDARSQRGSAVGPGHERHGAEGEATFVSLGPAPILKPGSDEGVLILSYSPEHLAQQVAGHRVQPVSVGL